VSFLNLHKTSMLQQHISMNTMKQLSKLNTAMLFWVQVKRLRIFSCSLWLLYHISLLENF